MSLWRQLTRGLRVLTHRDAADRDVADEVQHYLEQATTERLARGLSLDDARRAARLELGNATGVGEQVRAYGWENLIGASVADIRYAARRLFKSPGFTLVAVMTLALGIGASTAIFSAVNPILFEPLPYPQASRIMMIADHGSGGSSIAVTFGSYREIVARSRSFDAIAVMRSWQPTITGPDEPDRLNGQRVSAHYFRTLGLHPALGRDFTAEDDRVNGPRVAMLSDRLWRRRLAGNPAIVGQSIILDGEPYSVIGIMPRDFDNVLASSSELWAPLQYDVAVPSFDGREWGHHLGMIGRLRASVGINQATRELDGIARASIPDFPRPAWASMQQGLIVTSLQEGITSGVRPALLAVLGAVVLVLLTACVNVTNLLLARSAQRRGEFAVRAALGAGRSRLIRQLLAESVLLAAVGGAVGIAVAAIGVQALVAFAPPGLPRAGAIALDGPVYIFAFGITTLIGLVVGLMPALHASRSDLHASMQQHSRRTVGGQQATRGMLVIAEVALALVLLVGSGLLLRSLQRLFAIAPGFTTSHLLTMQVQESGRRFAQDSSTRIRFFREALEAVRRVPGVSGAAFTSLLPLSGDIDSYGVRFESGQNVRSDKQDDGAALRYAVSPGYFETMGIPILRGRTLDTHDLSGAPIAILINESFAKRRFPHEDPIGKRLRLGPDDGSWDTIVGVVGDVKQASLAAGETDAVYIPTTQWHWADNVLSLVVRSRGDAATLAPAVRKAIWSVDKDQPIVRVATIENLLAASAAERRFALIIFEAFAIVALVLAATGLYGMLSGSVTEGMREIGVRSALGASRGNILGLVLHEGMVLTGIGLIIGVAGAVAASQALVTLLFGISRVDPITYFDVIVLLAGVAAIACAVPAWRAARVDPAITLRTE